MMDHQCSSVFTCVYSMSCQAVTTARKIVQTMMDQHKQSLMDLVFSLWADHTFLMNNRFSIVLEFSLA
jgi:hypothetical protein